MRASTTPSDSMPGRHQSGSAIIQALLIVLIASFVVTMLVSNSIRSARTSQREADRSVGLPIADSAITRYLFALQSDIVTEGTDYVINAEGMATIKNQTAGAVVFANKAGGPSGLPVLPGDPTLGDVQSSVSLFDGAYTMREPLTTGAGTGATRYGFWQLYHIIRPNDYNVANAKATDDHSLVVYFRAWTGDVANNPITKPRIVRAQFRPGFFSDFQLITDSPIQYGDGASVDGPVHTNGYRVGSVPKSPFSVSTTGGTLSCGASAEITSSKGAIDGNIPNNCLGATGHNATGKVIDFLQAEGSFQAIARNAGQRTLVFPYDGTPSNVKLAGNDIYVDGNLLPPLNGRRPLALLFKGDVGVSGFIRGRLTIAAQSGISDGDTTTPGNAPPGAADIYLLGSTGIPTTGSGSSELPTNRGKDALGLIAEGNVYVPTVKSANACASEISAAIIAVSGRISLPINETTQIEQKNLRPCPSVDIYGSMASHMAPVLYWNWGAGGGSTGYAKRVYGYNAFLKEGAPPYFPRSSVWRLAGYKEANYDCLESAASRMDRGCR